MYNSVLNIISTLLLFTQSNNGSPRVMYVGNFALVSCLYCQMPPSVKPRKQEARKVGYLAFKEKILHVFFSSQIFCRKHQHSLGVEILKEKTINNSKYEQNNILPHIFNIIMVISKSNKSFINTLSILNI